MFDDGLLSGRIQGQWELMHDYANGLGDDTLRSRSEDELVA
jgi:hypothetical protein